MSIVNPYMEENLKLKSNVSAEDGKLRRRATYFSTAVAIILILTKLSAYIATNSVSLLSSLLDSTLDAVVSMITLLSVRSAMTPADADHRFGHGKIEPLAAMGQAFFIGASAIFLVFEAVNKFANPTQVTAPTVGIGVMILSIVLTSLLIAYQYHVIKKTKSLAIEADSLHYRGDLLMNLGVIIALVLSKYTDIPYFDPGFALIVAVILSHSAWSIGKGAANILMDRELPEEDRKRIEDIVLAHPKACSIHDLRTRSAGVQIFIEFHLEIDGQMRLTEAHDVTEEIELKLYDAFPTAEVLIHQEPAGIDDDRLDHRLDDTIDPEATGL